MSPDKNVEAVRQVRSISELAVGKVRVAALPSLAATVVPQVMARFAQQHPDIELQLHDTLSGPAFDLVRAGTVDFALTAANPDYADLDYTPLSAVDIFVKDLGLVHAVFGAHDKLAAAEPGTPDRDHRRKPSQPRSSDPWVAAPRR